MNSFQVTRARLGRIAMRIAITVPVGLILMGAKIGGHGRKWR